MRIRSTISLFFVFIASLLAQKNQSVQQLFNNDEKIEVLHFQGVLNGVHQINMSLGISGSICKGHYTYAGSKLTFQLEGTYENSFFELHEIDQSLNVSANINLELEDNLIKGQWSHIEKEISFPISALNVISFSKSRNDCRENSWQNMYEGVMENQNISIRLTKESDSDLFVNMIIATIPFDFTAHCDTPQCTFFKHNFKGQTGFFEELEFRRIDSSFLNITMIKSDRSRKLVSLRLNESLSYDCIDYSSYTSRYNLIYPKLKNLFFNKQILSIVSEWESSLGGQIDSLELLSPGQIPGDRFMYEATGWVDIIQFDKNFISGIFTFQKNWSFETERKAFNFHLKENKEIELDQVFKSSFDYQEYFDRYILKQKKNYVPFKQKYISKWIKDQPFDIINFTSEGIVFTSEFSNVYGSHEVLLTYGDVKKYLSKDFKKSLAIK